MCVYTHILSTCCCAVFAAGGVAQGEAWQPPPTQTTNHTTAATGRDKARSSQQPENIGSHAQTDSTMVLNEPHASDKAEIDLRTSQFQCMNITVERDRIRGSTLTESSIGLSTYCIAPTV